MRVTQIWAAIAFIHPFAAIADMRAQSHVVAFSRPASPTTSAVAPDDSLHLSIDSARTLAMALNPELRAASLDIAVAEGNLRQAGLMVRTNPSVDVLTGGIGTEYDLTQEIEIAGQQSARRASGRAGISRATESVRNVARQTLGDVDRAFYRVVAGQQRTALAREMVDLNQELLQITQRQLAAGEISRLELNLATVELGRARARTIATKRELDEFVSDLRGILGLPPERPVVAVFRTEREDLPLQPQLPSTDSLVSLALRRRPDLAESEAAVRQTSADLSVARREAFPNLALRGASERLEGSNSRVFRPGVGLTPPLFNLNRGEIAARNATARQAALSRAAVAARVRLEVVRARNSYGGALAEAQTLESAVLAPARENRRLLEIAYREGKVGLPVLLLIRNQVFDSEFEYWSAWLAEHTALADLAEATGEGIGSWVPESSVTNPR